MTKIQLGLAVGVAVALAVGLSEQLSTNSALEEELARVRARSDAVTTAAPPPASQSAPAIGAPANDPLDDAILVAAEFAVPLTPEQQERVRLDTIIRKGELDTGYAMLFRQLRLPPDTLDAFKTLLVERNQAIYDAKQVAKEERFVVASRAEERALGLAATEAIDQRIAMLLGADGFVQFREYEELEPFRGHVRGIAATNSYIYNAPEDDHAIAALARLLDETAPDFAEQVYQANGWPVDFPEDFVEKAVAFLGEPAAVKLEEIAENNAVRRRLFEIAREAALEGKLVLSDESARDYPIAPQPVAGR